MQKKDKLYILAIVVLGILFFLREGCNSNENTKLIENIQNYSDSAKYFKGLNDATIAFNDVLVLENEDQMLAVLSKYDTLAQELKKFKEVRSTTIIKERFVISNDTIKIDRIIPCDFEPFKVRRDSIHYNFIGTIGNNFFSIDTITIPNQQSIIVGTKKLGFLKKRETRVEIINSNPLVTVSNIGGYVIDNKKKWHQTRAFNLGLGFVGGFLTSQNVKK
jgi:hypothetical protein